jgi:uncharacterized phage-associated protein/DNA-binding transcriptional regulator YiaG
MKSPITGKEMVLKTDLIEHEFRKDKFDIVYHYYLCEDSGEKFEDERFMQLNLNQVYNQFRKKHNLPFPEEIIELREQYGLSASKMSEVLGFGINVYRSYENSEIPNSSNARLIQLAGDPKEFKRLIQLSDVLTEKESERVMAKIDELLLKDEFINFDLQNYLMGERTADDRTGYRIPNLGKFTEMVVFFTHETEPWKTKLNKLLFYADFCHFRKTGLSISGSRYRAIDMGPVPNNFSSIFEHLAERDDVDIYYTAFPNGSIGEQFKPHSKRDFDDSVFSEDELRTLKEVASKFGDTKTNEIIEISHEEEAWEKNFKDGKKLISYIDAFKLKNM